MKTMPVQLQHAQYPLGIIALTILTVFLFGCTISPSPRGMEKSLVSKDDPIFDTRFHDLSFHDIDTRGLWIERGILGTRENIVIHNNTFADLVDRKSVV